MSRSTRTPLVAGLAVLTSIAVAGPALATSDVTTRRLAGADRYSTAAAIAEATFPGGATAAVIASGERFPDALAAGYLAGRLDAPLLLTAGGSLPAATEAALEETGVSGVVIVGGTAAVSQAVQDRLTALGYEVERRAGADRYATARIVAESVPASFVGAYGAGATAIVASGLNFPDALAGSPLAYARSFPILLTPGDTLSSEARAALENLSIEQVIVLGGGAAVSAGVEQAIENDGIDVLRISGQTRQDTAALVADFAIDELGFEADHVNLARGDDFADALAGGPHEGVELAPVLLTVNPSTLGAAAAGFLQDRSSTVSSIDVLGGPNAVNEAVVAAADDAATTG